jgi:hypothetical protein
MCPKLKDDPVSGENVNVYISIIRCNNAVILDLK